MWTGSRGRRSGFVLAAVLMISVVLIAATTGFAWFARNQLRRVEGERAALQSRNLAFLTAFFVARGLTADQGEYDALDKPQFQPLGRCSGMPDRASSVGAPRSVGPDTQMPQQPE